MKRSRAELTHIFKHVQGKKNETFNKGENLTFHFKISFFQFVVLLSSSALAETCLQCSSIMSDKDQTKPATTIEPNDDFGQGGKNCFQPIATNGSIPSGLASMVVSCPGTSGGQNDGCYSLAYSIKREISLTRNSLSLF